MRWPWQRPSPPARRPGKRAFKSAKSDRLTISWDRYPKSIDVVLRSDLESLRARARDQARNSDYVRRYMHLMQTNIVGPTGVQIQARTADRRTNAALETAWDAWVADCDVTERGTLVDLQRLFVSSLCTDGEFVAKMHYGDGFGVHGVQIEVIDPARIATNLDQRLDNGHVIRLGVEYAGPKPVAIWLQDIDERGQYEHGRARREAFYIGQRPSVIHSFRPEYVGQSRGIPWVSTALLRLKMLSEYEDSAIIAARVGAAKAGFFYEAAGEEYVGDDEDEEGAVINEVEAGTFERLPSGVQFQPYDPTYPHEQYGDFTKRTLMGAAAGLGVGYNELANDPESVSYSTLRHFAISDRDQYKVFQSLLIGFVRKVRDHAWLPMAKLQGLFDNRFDVSSLRPATYMGRRWDWIDPEKDMNANKLAIAQGLTSRSQIIRDRGMDPETVFAEIQKEREMLQELGILPGGDK